ncbi:hypothetical protein COEREDRAFT_90149 [Coemansia reversa NRRL 1564]|uniref:Protein kinase domain-containing protein n=1 Tax=Coemansia reversa (strain ATCC 12441 / NRRL 1564) TaxID=763665 RepID=A0A2G5B0R1_COERN|nr:hypothetical protein COEREDRAFT_90149 [Coemansia reversa NRRL 1564]|eukprot:PIA12608.1 hypothetical protein COEREDRAFT_90149 [Coemansia reversa NRRL 1564]
MEYENTDIILRRYFSVKEKDFDNLHENAKKDVVECSTKRRLEEIVKKFSKSIAETFENNLILLNYECDLSYLKYGWVRNVVCNVFNIEEKRNQVLKIVNTSWLVFPFKNEVLVDFKREHKNLELLEGSGFVCPKAYLVSSSCGYYTFLLMDKIVGTPIKKFWPFISSDEQKEISNEIDLYMENINNLSELDYCELSLSDFIYNDSKIVGLANWGVLKFNDNKLYKDFQKKLTI